MTTMSPENEESLRQMFRFFNRFMVLLFRLGLGGWGNRPELSQVMVLIHTGRKSGLSRRTPVNYAVVDGDIYCTAAYGRRADWYKNIMADARVEVWLRDGWWGGVAEEVPDDDPQRNALMRQVLIASGFATPLFTGMNPKTLSDAALTELTTPYRLIRIRRNQVRTGPGGPGDLVWVWPVTATALLGWFLLQRLRRYRV